MKLTDFKALTFDCYGTLIDWESGMIAGLDSLTARLPKVMTRDQVLQAHARHESAQQARTPSKRYNVLLSVVYKRLAEEWGLQVTREECVAYGQSVQNWPAFSDTVEALRYLKNHYKLIILSNVDNDSFAASNKKLNVAFDAIYTAEDIGSYKPSDSNFDYMLEKLKAVGIQQNQILHTAESIFHDHVPGKRHGLASCWIYRRHEQSGFGATMHPGDLPSVDFQFNSMAALAEAHKRALAE